MAKTLVGLYDSLTDAERVVQDLVESGFSRSDIRIAAPHVESRRGDTAYVGEWISVNGEGEMIDTLTDLGVPTDEASSYAEGVRRGGALVILETSDDWADRGLEIMDRMQPVDIEDRVTLWRQEGWTGHSATSASAASAASVAPTTGTPTTTTTTTHTEVRPGRNLNDRRIKDDKDVAIPVVEEELSVGKREVQRGRIRIHTRVKEVPVEETVRLREETVRVERRPVDRPATAAELNATAEETIELTETAEEAVVSKRARVVEEVVVHKDVEERTETVRDTVRHTDVDIDRDAGEYRRTGHDAAHDMERTRATAATTGFSTYDADWRQHHNTMFLNRGAYTDYEPAYRYGYELRQDTRYQGRDWAAMEADVRRDWETRHAGTWERFKDAIRYGWDKVAGSGSRTHYADSDFDTYTTDWRQHHNTTFLNRGAYDDYMPAYRYGYDLSTNERYRGRNWADIEGDIRSGWETQRPGTWERFKDAVRYGWDRMRARV
jgi:uncharacterized protein (TIGR02271 family)